jgi:2-polyprenyl-6-methoxyphenol hydroxylase-like FAD-dependent oxidoreductase
MARRISVLIVGGGPVGLALAVELGSRGIACELIEQSDGVIATPKMNEVNIRTMEFCRRWGIADRVLNCPFPADYPLDVVFVTSLSGYELGRLPRPPRNQQKPDPWSPMRLQACSQHWFDPILRDFARSLSSVTLRYGSRLETFEQSQQSVTAWITDVANGKIETVEADYLVGCDGAGSMVRGRLGIELVGEGTIGHPINMFFRKP